MCEAKAFSMSLKGPDTMTKIKTVVEFHINCKVGECHFPLTGLELDN